MKAGQCWKARCKGTGCKLRWKHVSVEKPGARAQARGSCCETVSVQFLPSSALRFGLWVLSQHLSLNSTLTFLSLSLLKMINTSLTTLTSIVPDCFKMATVKPLIKKLALDVNDFKNFRPVSNLPFLLEILGKLSWQSLNPICAKATSKKFVSQYMGKNHSSEALSFCVTVFFVTLAIDLSFFLLLLDQSAAFHSSCSSAFPS